MNPQHEQSSGFSSMLSSNFYGRDYNGYASETPPTHGPAGTSGPRRNVFDTTLTTASRGRHISIFMLLNIHLNLIVIYSLFYVVTSYHFFVVLIMRNYNVFNLLYVRKVNLKLSQTYV